MKKLMKTAIKEYDSSNGRSQKLAFDYHGRSGNGRQKTKGDDPWNHYRSQGVIRGGQEDDDCDLLYTCIRLLNYNGTGT